MQPARGRLRGHGRDRRPMTRPRHVTCHPKADPARLVSSVGRALAHGPRLLRGASPPRVCIPGPDPAMDVIAASRSDPDPAVPLEARGNNQVSSRCRAFDRTAHQPPLRAAAPATRGQTGDSASPSRYCAPSANRASESRCLRRCDRSGDVPRAAVSASEFGAYGREVVQAGSGCSRNLSGRVGRGCQLPRLRLFGQFKRPPQRDVVRRVDAAEGMPLLGIGEVADR